MVTKGVERFRMGVRVRSACVVGVVVLTSAHVFGQWVTYPTQNVPRLADGKPNLKAPAPRQPDGKPDFMGFWQPDRMRECTPDLASRVRLAKPCTPGEMVNVPNGPASVACRFSRGRRNSPGNEQQINPKTTRTSAASRILIRVCIGSPTSRKSFTFRASC
jgi:hypothetical protein